MVRAITVQRGFTLLEVVIYLALFTVLMTGVLRTVYEIMETTHEADVSLQIQNDGNFVLQKMAWALNDVKIINVIGTSTLEIVRNDDSEHPLNFSLDHGRFYLARGNDAATPLTSAQNTVHDVSLELTHPTPETNYLKVSFFINDAPFSLAWPQYE
jgi:prepilin-type N-terminal cleavage/methylation domain-containing protein